ncbi:MAG: malate dehydrogenase [Desulfarculales bacterium]|jgi:malate dehydrogenase|nr:malate dehydrogenase [Desulfarculales bacterium]
MRYKITVIGAGNVGASCACLIAEKELADVVLLDVLDGLPQGKALDMAQALPHAGRDLRLQGSTAWEDTENSDLIIVTAGIARKPGMSRDDLLKINAEIVRNTVQKAALASPGAILIVVSNPLDAMCHVAFKASSFPPSRVLGMAGVLDTARMRLFIAQALNVSVESVHALVLGGHGDTMVPLPRLTNIAGIPLPELLDSRQIEAISHRTAQGGAEIVSLLKSGSAYYGPAASVVEMAESILKDKKKVLPCAAWLSGQYGYSSLFLGVPVKLGRDGIEQIYELALTADEQAALDKSALAVGKLVDDLTKLGY